MKLQPKASFVLSWILAFVLTLTPVMAQTQNSPVPIATDSEEAASAAQQQRLQDPTTPVAGEATNPEGTSVPAESPEEQPEAEFPNVERTSTMMAGSSTAQQQSQGDPPGKSKWIVLAALLATGAVVAAVLLFRGFGGGDSEEDPVGTVISAGTPSVNPPNQ